jgi:hypothetical protein
MQLIQKTPKMEPKWSPNGWKKEQESAQLPIQSITRNTLTYNHDVRTLFRPHTPQLRLSIHTLNFSMSHLIAQTTINYTLAAKDPKQLAGGLEAGGATYIGPLRL